MKKKDLYKIIGKNIQAQIKLKGYTQETFAEKMKVSWSYVAKIESGAINISIGKIYDLSKFLKVSVSKLLNIKE